MARRKAQPLTVGSIEDTVARLLSWAKHAPKGLARAEFDSEFARQQVVHQLHLELQDAGIPFYEIELPRQQPPGEVVRFLIEQLRAFENGDDGGDRDEKPTGGGEEGRRGGKNSELRRSNSEFQTTTHHSPIVSIAGFATAFPPDVLLTDALQVLNFSRENLAQFPLCQIWWMTRSFAEALLKSAPDLSSWFMVRVQLTEPVTSPLEIGLFVLQLGGFQAHDDLAPRRLEEARKQSADLTARFKKALKNEADLPTLLDLASAAVTALLDVEARREAQTLARRFTNVLESQFLMERTDSDLSRRWAKAVKAENPDMIRALISLAVLYQSQARPADAESLLRRALRLNEKTFGEQHPGTAAILKQLARLYGSEGRYAEAEASLKRALLIQEQVLGNEHADTLLSQNDLARIYYEQQRYAEAESLLEKALAIRQKTFGADHWLTAASLDQLALIYQSQGRFAEAEPLFNRALAIRERVVGSEHPQTAQSRDRLAGLYFLQGRYIEAENLYRLALAIKERMLGSEHLETAESLDYLALVALEQGRYPEAEPLLKQAVAIKEKMLGLEHPKTAMSLYYLGHAYARQGRLSEAQPLLKQARRVLEPRIHAWFQRFLALN